MLNEGPSKLYDALSSVLGLDDLVAVEKLLGNARKTADKHHKDARKALQPLLAQLEPLDDARAHQCAQALGGPRWDLDAAESVLLGATAGAEPSEELELLRRLCSVQGPSAEDAMEAAQRLRGTTAGLETVAGTDAERARALADLLQRALEFHAGHGDGGCPVCGRQDALDATWRAAAETQTVALRKAAESAAAAHRRHRQAVEAARELLTDPPGALGQAGQVGVDASSALLAWRRWAQGRPSDDPLELAQHLETRLDPLLEALEAVRASARSVLDRKENEWRPVARDLLEWLPVAGQAQRTLTALPCSRRPSGGPDGPPQSCGTSASSPSPPMRNASGSCSASSRTWSWPGSSWREPAPGGASSWTSPWTGWTAPPSPS